jgi:hypothetical protein
MRGDPGVCAVVQAQNGRGVLYENTVLRVSKPRSGRKYASGNLPFRGSFGFAETRREDSGTIGKNCSSPEFLRT